MNLITFIEKYGQVNINGPSYRGEPCPPFQDDSINVSEFADELRPKEITIFNDSDDTIQINWISQDWNEDLKPFYNEIKRCYKYLMNKFNIKEPLLIIINLWDRQEEHSERKEFTIENS